MGQFYSGKAFKASIDGALAVVDFDLQGEKVNKFSETSLRDLDDLLAKLEATKGTLTGVLFRSAKPKSFIVGADIKVIEAIRTPDDAVRASEYGQQVFNRLADFPLPTVAAIEGVCMGGGTEFSLACDYRVASDSDKTQIALPEVKLGIYPGWGGTFRLPRLVDLPTALDIILTGKSLNAKKAYKAGILDEVYPEGLFPSRALEYAKTRSGKRVFTAPKAANFVNKLLSSNFIGRNIIFKKTRETIQKTTGGHYPAPLVALDVIESSWGKSQVDWLKKEREGFAELAIGEVSKNLIRIFFMGEAAKKDTGTNLSAEEIKALKPIQQVAVLGAGVMGAGIAAQSASRGLWVQMKDINFQAVGKGLAHARGLFQKAVDRKKSTPQKRDEQIRHLHGQTDYSGFKGLDLVIEAVTENLDLKHKVFAEVEANVSDDCIIATNTSSLRLKDIETPLKKTERFLGLHFFNPVDKMLLVEVVVNDKTPPATTARAVNYVKAIGKTPLVTKDGPGFLVNRLLVPYMLETGFLIDDGADLEKIDKEIKKWGMPMGPYELMDEVGLDVVAKICPVFEQSLGERYKAPKVIFKIADDAKGGQKRYGKKTGLGFYKWEKNKRVAFDREGIEAAVGHSLSGEKFLLSGDALAHRMIFPMINEAAVVLEEKIVAGPDKVDLGLIYAIGFPPFRGGLCRYADSIGLEKIYKDLERMAATYGPRFKPTEALKRAAAGGGKFYK